MRYYAGLDVSLAETSVCVVDEEGKIIREAKVASDPEALAAWLGGLGLMLARVGLETGALAGWLCEEMTELGVPGVVGMDARHARAAMVAMTHKTDRNDARALAQMLRTGWFRRLMTVPGVGAVAGLTYIAAIEDPARFAKSRSVGAVLGMVPRKHQPGEVDRDGRITKTGDTEARAALFEVAHVMLYRVKKWSGLEAWAAKVAQRQGTKRATVALARKMAVVMHRVWVDCTTFRRGAAETSAPVAAA